MLRVLAISLLFASAACAQSVAEVDAGASNFIGYGASTVLYSSSGETHLSMGELSNRFVWSASHRFQYQKWIVALGDYQFPLSSGQMYLIAPVRGVSLVKRDPHGELDVFAGAVGSIYSSPYFWGLTRSHAGGGFSYHRAITKDWTIGTIQAVSGPVKTSLEEARYKHKWFDSRGDVGWLQNSRQVSGSASASWLHFGLTGTRATYMFAPLPDEPQTSVLASKTTVNSASAFGGFSILTGSANVFESNLSHGQSYSAGVRIGLFSTQYSLFKSTSDFNHKIQKQDGQLLAFSERVGLHLSLTQYVSRSQGSTSYSFGAAYSTNRLSFQVGQNLEYFPLLAKPWQQVLSCQVSFRLRGVSVNAGTVAMPDGRVQWQTGGTDYLPVPLHVPALPGATPADIRSLETHGHGGRYTIHGLAVDSHGQPVEGVALKIDGEEIFTDTQGRFSIRERKNKRYSIQVIVPDFMDAGEWRVKSCPAEVSPDEVVNIVLERV